MGGPMLGGPLAPIPGGPDGGGGAAPPGVDAGNENDGGSARTTRVRRRTTWAWGQSGRCGLPDVGVAVVTGAHRVENDGTGTFTAAADVTFMMKGWVMMRG